MKGNEVQVADGKLFMKRTKASNGQSMQRKIKDNTVGGTNVWGLKGEQTC